MDWCEIQAGPGSGSKGNSLVWLLYVQWSNVAVCAQNIVNYKKQHSVSVTSAQANNVVWGICKLLLLFNCWASDRRPVQRAVLEAIIQRRMIQRAVVACLQTQHPHADCTLYFWYGHWVWCRPKGPKRDYIAAKAGYPLNRTLLDFLLLLSEMSKTHEKVTRRESRVASRDQGQK